MNIFRIYTFTIFVAEDWNFIYFATHNIRYIVRVYGWLTSESNRIYTHMVIVCSIIFMRPKCFERARQNICTL